MGLLDGLFKDKSSSVNKEEIEKLNAEIKEKEKEIQRLELELQMIKETYMPPKQVELFEKNLKNIREENQKLKKEKDEYLEKIKYYEGKNTEDSKIISLNRFLYKLPIDDFFSATKYNLIKEFLVKSGVTFIQEIEAVIDLPEFSKVKNYSSAKKKYLAFRDKKEVSWDSRVLLCRGDRVQKVFKKSRKFVNYLSDNNIEFMDEIEKFDFEKLLVKGGFTKEMIKELKEISEDYFKTYKI